jgi:hypothetical protein
MKRFVAVVAVFCLLGVLAWADGGERPITEPEKAFYQNSYQKLVSLMPLPPQGVERNLEKLFIPQNLGLGAEKYPLSFLFQCGYQKSADMGKMMDIAKDAQGLEDLSTQMTQISAEIEAAVNAGDSKKAMELQEKMQAVMLGNSTMQQMQGAVNEQKSQSLNISVSINANGADFFQYSELPALTHVTHAIRREKSDVPEKSFTTTETVLFFGPYKKKKVNETFEIYVPHPEAESTKVHRLILRFEGEAKLADEYIAKMNLAGLAGLIQ